MCNSSATLTYGILVRTISLCIAAKQWAAVSPTLEAIDLIKLRRGKGVLVTEEGHGAVGRVPDEVWDMVKTEVVAVVAAKVERKFVLKAHQGRHIERGGTVPPEIKALQAVNADEVYDLDHLMTCEACYWGVVPADLRYEHEAAIDAFLAAFGLLLPAEESVSWGECQSGEFYNLSLITLEPDEVDEEGQGDTTWARRSVTIRHGHCDCAQNLIPLAPSFFSLPPDANKRFKTFLSSGFTLHTGSFASSAHASESSRQKEWLEHNQKVAFDSAGEDFDTDEPRWMLWTAGQDCARC